MGIVHHKKCCGVGGCDVLEARYVGRPKKITERVLHKLEEGFIMGLTDKEACIYADVAPSTLYDYCKAHEEFSERKELLKESVKMRAKINVARKIKSGEVGVSTWYLERKCKEDFSLKQEIKHSGDMNITNPISNLTTDELRKLIDSG